ncbi:hypothetical protein GCM10027406_20370 [Leifsonia lichenia]
MPVACPAFSGTGEPGASIVVSDQGGAELASTTVRGGGSWSVASAVAVDVADGDVTATVTQTAGDAVSTATVAFSVSTAVETAPLVVSSPIAGATVDTRTPVYAGTGHPGALVEVRGSTGRVLGSTTVAEDGTWSVASAIELPDGGYLGSVEHTFGGASTVAALSYSVAVAPAVAPAIPTRPFVVTSPAVSQVIGSPVPVFSGTGTPGAVVEIRGSSGRLVATTTVDADGAWSATSTLTLLPIDSGFSVTSPASGAEVDGPRPVYTGFSEPGATVKIVGSTTRIVATAVADMNGSWTAHAAFDLIPGRYIGTAVEVVDGETVGVLTMEYFVKEGGR